MKRELMSEMGDTWCQDTEAGNGVSCLRNNQKDNLAETVCEGNYCVKSQTEVILEVIGMCQSLLHERVIWPDLCFKKITLASLWRVKWSGEKFLRQGNQLGNYWRLCRQQVIRIPN